MRVGRCASALALAVLLAGLARPADAEQVTLRVAPYISDALTKAIADNAEPTARFVPAGEKLDRFVRDKCGTRRRPDDAYWALLKDANPDLDVTAKLTASATIIFPACANWSEGTFPVKVRTNLQDVARDTIGLSDPGVVAEIRRFNKLQRKFIPDETKIPFDQIVLVPAISYPVSLETNGTADDFARAVFAAIKPNQKSYPSFTDDAVCIEQPLDPIVLLCKKTRIGMGAGVNSVYPGCTDVPSLGAIRFAEILTTAAAIESKKKSCGISLQPTLVFVGDVGLKGYSHLPINWPWREAFDVTSIEGGRYILGEPSGALGAANLEPDDRYHPPGWDRPAEVLAHGTHVVGIVSGAAFSTASPLEPGDLAPLKDYFHIVPFSFLQRSQVPEISNSAVQSIIQTASGKAAVVNLSILDLNDDEQFQAAFADAPVVIVVAAGNSNFALGEGANQAQSYPAMYGGYMSDHVITVAATTADGVRAPFSNYSQYYVDLGAPGCDINSIGDAATLSRLELNGTSQASPLVTMTAALLQHFRIQDRRGHTSAHIIKERILSSVDPKPDLDVYAGGTLNVIKALRFDRDIVTLNQTVNDLPAGQPIYGEVQKPSILTPCSDENPQRLKSLNHVVPQFGQGKSLVSLGTGADFKIVRCAANPFEITFAAESGSTLHLRSDQIADIVFMNPAMRSRSRCERN